MQLDFIPSTIITTDATNPTAVHMPDNSIWGFRVETERLEGSQIQHGPGDIDYSAFALADFAIVTADKNMSLVRFKNIRRLWYLWCLGSKFSMVSIKYIFYKVYNVVFATCSKGVV